MAALADSLVADIAKRYPMALDVAGRSRITNNRLIAVVDRAITGSEVSYRERTLGWWARRRLTAIVDARLADLGYSEQFRKLAASRLGLALESRLEGANPNRGS